MILMIDRRPPPGSQLFRKIVVYSTTENMAKKEQFIEAAKNGYNFKGESIRIGRAVLDGEVVEGADIMLPLKTLNRHGLIAGATGTGKTKTLQNLWY